MTRAASPAARWGGERAACVAAGAAALLLACAVALAWRDDSPLVPRNGGLADDSTARVFLALLAAAFAAYLVGLLALRGRDVRLLPVAVIAVVIQLVPLGAPLLLSTDAWTYWAYGWIGTNGGNPYIDEPSTYPLSPAYPHMGAAWRDTTTVYGPVFTLASEPLAVVSRDSAGVAAWLYKVLGGVAMVAATLLAARVSHRRALAAAFVGWNPLVAVHAAGGGHNDAWLAATLAAALALAASGRPVGEGVAWALAVLLKWVPLYFLALRVLEPRRPERRVSRLGLLLAAAAVAVVAGWRFGLDWLTAFAPLAGNAALETSYALPARLQDLGIPESMALALAVAAFVAGSLCLGWQARRNGQARLGRAACLVLLTTPYLIVWYLAWAATLAAADDDRVARAGVLALSVYLLPQTIPL